MNPEGPPLTASEAATALNVSRRFIAKLCACGALPFFRLPSAGTKGRPGRLRIPRARIVEMLANRERRAGNVEHVENREHSHTQGLDSGQRQAVASEERWTKESKSGS